MPWLFFGTSIGWKKAEQRQEVKNLEKLGVRGGENQGEWCVTVERKFLNNGFYFEGVGQCQQERRKLKR